MGVDAILSQTELRCKLNPVTLTREAEQLHGRRLRLRAGQDEFALSAG